MTQSLNDADLAPMMAQLATANAAFSARYPGTQLNRVPVHTLYGGAHLFKSSTPAKLSQLALSHFERYAPDETTLATALGLSEHDQVERIVPQVFDRVKAKLGNEAIEDIRLDFEDGYGARANAEEDQHAVEAAEALASAAAQNLLPPFVGIRIKALTEESKARAIRTLDVFLSAYSQSGSALPAPFFVTLPKVTSPQQVAALVDCIELLEARCGFDAAAISVELMIETAQSIFDPAGANAIPALIAAGRGRVTSAVLGTFDYTASCNIASHHQDHLHPSADFARQMMQATLSGTAVNLCDGITNIMPIAPHTGDQLSERHKNENMRTVHAAWKLHFDNVLHSLRLGFYQGWDLNPAQLPVRFAACYFFFLDGVG